MKVVLVLAGNSSPVAGFEGATRGVAVKAESDSIEKRL